MKKKPNILNYLFYSIALFLILPNNIKELPFILLGIYSIVIFIKTKKIDTKVFISLSLFFFINLISLFFTDNISYGFNRIGGISPFFYLVLSYAVFLKMDLKITTEFVEKWILLFNFSNLFFLLVFIVFFFFQPLIFTYNNIRTVLDNMPFINIHPIYLSIVSVLGILSCVYIYKSNPIQIYILILSNVVLLILSGARATSIGFFLIVIITFSLKTISFKNKFIVFFITLMSIVILFCTENDFKKRFRELILTTSYSKLNVDNSTSIRIAIWKCTLEQIKNTNILFGEGVGDVASKLQESYDKNYPELGKYYNTHNQYFSIILGTGLLGLFCFLYFFFYVLSKAIRDKNNFLLILTLFYFYMFNFENIIERKYGILLFLFFTLFVFDIFIAKKEQVIDLV